MVTRESSFKKMGKSYRRNKKEEPTGLLFLKIENDYEEHREGGKTMEK